MRIIYNQVVYCLIGQLSEFMYSSCAIVLHFLPDHLVIKLDSGAGLFIPEKRWSN